MTTYEIEFHKVSSLPLNNKNYRGHVFFNDATNEPIETIIDGEGNEIKRRRYERGIYLCAYDNSGALNYIPYTVAGAGDDSIGIDVDTLNDRITIWASKFQNDIQKLAKLTVDPDQILAQVKKFYNELNGEIAELRIKSDQIKAEVAKYVDGVKEQYSQFTIEADKINSKVEDLKEGYSMIEQTAKGITTRVENLEHDWSQVEQTATELKSTVHSDINKLESRISQTAGQISLEVEDKINNVNSRIEQLPNQIKMEVSDEFDSASIITRINDGDSEVKIHADKIILDGAAIANSLMIDGSQEVNDLFDQYKDNITGDLQTSIDELKMQIDGTVDNWYYSHYPVGWSADSSKHASNTISDNTENNIPQDKIEVALKLSTTPKADVEPYASWIKGIADGKDDRPAHIGDTFTNTNFQQEGNDVRDGRTWKFCATIDSDGGYSDYRWEPMSDSASVAMKSIIDLENRVSNKRQVFIEQPTVPYDKGDLWVIMESTDGNTSAKNIYVCITPKTNIDVDTFSEADWISTNNFVGEDIFDIKIDEVKSELVDQINTEVSKVDLRDVIVKTGLIEFKDGSYVPVNGLISKATDANGVETLTMRVDGEDITWQITQGVDEKGNAYLVANKPWGDPSDPTKSSFVVDQNGLLTAHNAVIYGKIYAGSGEIGGIDIHGNSISSSNNNFSVTDEGVLTAKSGTIGGIDIHDNSISSSNDNFKVTAEGELTTKSGTIGGIEISNNSISSSNGKFSVTNEGELTAKSGTIGGIDIHDNSISSSNDNFKVTAEGVLTATNANITGTINATNGTIGGITINDNNITSSSNSGNFSVTNEGLLTATNANIEGTINATDGTIGGIEISNNSISSSNGNFSVTADGKLTATDAEIKGKITATDGAIGGIEIHGNNISSSNGNFSVTTDGVLTATNANITGTINATSLNIGPDTSIPQDKVSGLSNKFNDIQNYIEKGDNDLENRLEHTIDILNDSVKTQISSISTVVAQVKDQLSITKSDLESSMSEIKDLLNNFDSQVEFWYGEDDIADLDGTPIDSVMQKVGMKWTTPEDKKLHIGDIYVNTKTGSSWTYAYDPGDDRYVWKITNDTLRQTIQKITDLQKDLDTLNDNKVHAFFGEDAIVKAITESHGKDPKEKAYNKGDLWSYKDSSNNDIIKIAIKDDNTETTTIDNYKDDWCNLATSAFVTKDTQYIKDALKSNTLIDGGLILSKVIAVTANDRIMSGMNASEDLDYQFDTTYYPIAFFAGSNAGNGGNEVDKIRNSNFIVTNAGELLAKKAKIIGDITATSGTIGGITISNNSISSGGGKFSVTDQGVLTAKSGTIGGITISNNSISSGGGKFSVTDEGVLTAKSGTIGGIKINDNSISSDGDKFSVTAAGKLTATDANIEGVIKATSGTIGGITISNNSISSGGGKFSVTDQGVLTAKSGTIGGIAISDNSISGGEYFKVTKGGELTAKSGTIGGITISNNSISSGGGKFSVTDQGVLTAKSGTIGGITISNNSISSGGGKFSVTDQGVLTATNANITGTINATSLSIGSNVKIPQNNVKDLTNTLTNLQNQISNITGGSGGSTTSDWLTNAFQQTSVDGGLLLSGNIFVADNNKKITAGMMGASATNPSTTPRFFAGNPKNNISSSSTNLGPSNIYGNADNPNYPFIVTADGHLYATDAEIAGNINATSGAIGGITISGNSISGGGKFSVTDQGVLTAKSGTIGGIKINDNSISSDGDKFSVTAVGKLTATDAELTGTLKVTRTIKNADNKEENKTYDIGDYIIGKINGETNEFDMSDTISGAIAALNNEVFGPVMTEDEEKDINGGDDAKKTAAINKYNERLYKTLFGRVLQAEGKILALQNDIKALKATLENTGGSGGSTSPGGDGSVTFSCPTCSGRYVRPVNDPVPEDPGKKYGEVESIICPTCGAIAYKSLTVTDDADAPGDTSNNITNIVNPTVRPIVPVFKDTGLIRTPVITP